MSDDRHDAVRRRAYELWEREGGEHGRHEEYWHRARQEMGEGVATADDADATATAPAEIVAPDGTTMTDTAATATEVTRPARKPAAKKAEPAPTARPRKKAK